MAVLVRCWLYSRGVFVGDLRARGCVSVTMCMLARMPPEHQPSTLTEIALMLGSSIKPPDRAIAPVRLPASRHKPDHDFAKTMAAQ